jgi:hypothetical protein
MQRTERFNRREMVINYLLGLLIPVDMDTEKLPNASTQDGLFEIGRFFADIDSNSLIVIFFALFWHVNSIVINVMEVLLYRQWGAFCYDVLFRAHILSWPGVPDLVLSCS